MRDIAEAAALSPANLYNYFQSKHEILFFCQSSSLDRMLDSLEKARRARTTAAARLRQVMVSHLHCLLDEVEGSAAHLLTDGLPRHQQEYLLEQRDRYERGVRNLILSGMRRNEFVPSDAALMARAMLGALNWSVQWYRPDGSQTAEEIAEKLADYLLRGLLAQTDSFQKFAPRREISQILRKETPEVAQKRAAQR